MQIYDHDEGSEKISSHQKISNVIAMFGTFAVLTIGLSTTNYANDNIIRILLVIILLILIIGLFNVKQNLISCLGKKKQNKLAKFHFKKFKKLVLRFDKFTDQHENIRKAIVEIQNHQDAFSIIHIPELTLSDNLYEYYKVHLDQFNGTKINLVALAKEFENILQLYNKLYIREPLNEIKNIGSDKVNKKYKNDFNKYRENYIIYINSYKDFANDANNDFEGRVFRDYFDSPDEL